MSMDTCPPDPENMADLYIMGHLNEEDLVSFERHLTGCTSCRQEVQRSRDFRIAIGGAAASLGAQTAPMPD